MVRKVFIWNAQSHAFEFSAASRKLSAMLPGLRVVSLSHDPTILAYGLNFGFDATLPAGPPLTGPTEPGLYNPW